MRKTFSRAIIDIPDRQDFHDQQPEFEVEIKQNGRTIYHNKTYAVVMNLVQTVTTIDEKKGEMEGDSQILCVGHPIVQLFALDQLRQKWEKSGMLTKAMEQLEALNFVPDIKKALSGLAARIDNKNIRIMHSSVEDITDEKKGGDKK